MAKKSTASSKKSTNKTIAARTVPIAPEEGAPAVPDGFAPPEGATVKSYRKPSSVQRTFAGGMADELAGAPQYKDYFGTTAPDPQKLADRLRVAASWDAQYETAAAWAEYALAMRMFAWDSALGTLDTFRETFGPVLRRSDAAGKLYPETAKFFGVRTAQAVKANKTRQRNKKNSAKPAT